MKIGIDIDDLSRPLTGIGRYTTSLLQNLLMLDGKDEHHLYHLHPLIQSDVLRSIIERSIVHKSNLSSTTIWNQIILPHEIHRDRLNVLLSPSVRSPIISKIPTVLTIHDMIPFIYPEHFPTFDRVYMTLLLRAVANRCDHFIAVSNSTKEDICTNLNVSDKKISVVYHGIEPKFKVTKKATAKQQLQNSKIPIPERYILYVGTIEPRKNVANLVKAFFKVVEMGSDYKLVIVGKRGWGAEDFWSLIDHPIFKKNVQILGHVTEDLLPLLYAGADIFVYPSLLEGFGFPPLEAMACGTPVIINNTPALVEICNDAAVVTDARSVEMLAKCIHDLSTSVQLQDQFIQKGLQHVQKFTWKSTATETRSILETHAI